MKSKLNKTVSRTPDNSLTRGKPVSRTDGKNITRIGKFMCFLIVFQCLINQIQAQNFPPASVGLNYQGNTGAQIIGTTINPLAVGSPDTWSVSFSPSVPYVPAISFAPPTVPINFCDQFSGNQGNWPWNKWITHPSINCGGVQGMYCGGSVTDLYFAKQIIVPVNTVFMVDWSIWAGDWVQAVYVNSNPAYTAPAFTPPNYPSNRQNGVRFRWCNWNYGGVNTIVIHVRTRPGLVAPCQVAGLKVESFGTNQYLTVSGNPTVCPNTSNVYSVATATSLGFPAASSYAWLNPGGWTGGSLSNSITLLSSLSSGTMSSMIYTTSTSGSTCLAIGIFSVTVPQLAVAPTATTVCLGNPVVLSASGASSYTWVGPNSVTLSTSSSVVITPFNNGNYTVYGSTPLGCVISTVVPIVVLPNVFMTAFTSTNSVCQGQSLNVSISGNSVNGYTYTPPVGTPTTGGNALTLFPSASGIYSVSGTNWNGCVGTRTIAITVRPNPTVTASSNPSVICAGSSSTLTASGASGYTWSPGGSTSAVNVVSPLAPTFYSVTGTGTNGCTSTVSLLVGVLGAPLVTSSPPFICPFITNTLTAMGAISYTWYIGPPTGTAVATGQSTLLASPGNFVYSVCGSGPNGCSACVTVTLTNGSAATPVLTNTTLCTNAGQCMNLITTSTLGATTFTWLPMNTVNPFVSVCPTVATVYTVNASSPLGCPATSTVSVGISTNCCSTNTLGTTVLSAISGTMTNASYVLDSPVSVSGLAQLQDIEIFATPAAQIIVPPGATLDLDHVHIFSCGFNMWNGIVVQDGGRITTDYYNSRLRSSMIEDALCAIDLDGISVTNSGAGTPPIEIQRIIFNKNYIGIKISNSAPALTSLPLGITGCVFSSRQIPFTFGSPSSNASWASADMLPGGPYYGNNFGLKVPVTPTDALTSPYPLNNYPQSNLNLPYGMQPGHIGIKIENIGDPSSTAVTSGVDIGFIFPGYIYPDYNIFDGLGHGIDITDASLSIAGGVFQNMQVYSIPSGLFGGNGIADRTTGFMNTRLEVREIYSGILYPASFYDCVNGINLDHIYELSVQSAIFRSTQSALQAMMPMLPGESGIVSTTNRFNYGIADCQFNNVKNGIIFNTDAPGTGYNISGSPTAGTYANGLKINHNYFGPEVYSSDPYSSGSANTSEYMSTAIQLNTQSTPFWQNNTWVNEINSNRIDRCFRGININSMESTPLTVGGNSVYIEDDYTYNNPSTGLPAFGYGIAAYNGAANVSISSNTLEAIISGGPNVVSLIYCDNTQGPTVNCNYVSNSNYGFEFSGNNPGTVWQGNTMCTNWAGLALTNGGVIGPQGNMSVPSGNLWDQTCLPWGFGAALNETYCDNSNPASSPLFVNGGSGFNPTNNNNAVFGGPTYSLGTSIFITGSPFPTGLCSISYPNVPSWRTASNTDENASFAISAVNPNVRVYPNPANGRVLIDYPEQTAPVQLTVFDLTSKMMDVLTTIENSRATIDVSPLPASVYLLELKLEDGSSQRFKLVKTN